MQDDVREVPQRRIGKRRQVRGVQEQRDEAREEKARSQQHCQGSQCHARENIPQVGERRSNEVCYPELQMVPEPEAQRTQIQRIVQSKAFRTSAVHRNLLTYLAEKSLSGTADGLKEYTVGLDVFSKPSSYDPRQE